MMVKKSCQWLIIILLIAYVLILLFYTVLNRDPVTSGSVKLNLFWGYDNPTEAIYRDNIRNILIFIPVGVLAGVAFKKYRIVKTLLVGLLVSLTIEFLQLIWSRGTFDVDDLFNNTLGTAVGVLLVAGGMWIVKRVKAQDS